MKIISNDLYKEIKMEDVKTYLQRIKQKKNIGRIIVNVKNS